MGGRILIVYNGIPVKRGTQLKFNIGFRRKQRGRGRTIYIEHTGSVLRLTKSGMGVILKGIDVPGEYSRRFEELPDLQNRAAPAPGAVCVPAEVCA